MRTRYPLLAAAGVSLGVLTVIKTPTILKKVNRGETPRKEVVIRQPKILLFDIETAPSLGYHWGRRLYDTEIIEDVEEWYIMCFAYKWLHEKTIRTVGLPSFKLYQREPENDREVVKALHKLFSQADIVIAHNAAQFDVKKANARFAFHGLGPASTFRVVDTCTLARRFFGFSSNKLAHLGKYLGLGGKVAHMGFKTWRDCMLGVKSAWRLMLRYNIQDVRLLEAVYLRLRPWMTNHPNVGAYSDSKRPVCPHCGSENLKKDGFKYTQAGKYQSVYCRDCRSYGQFATNLLNKEKRKAMARP